jgi:DNA polymerase-3 subunit epsilon
MPTMTFTAIDFETAIGHHPCSVGIVTVENGVVVDEFVSLIRPPNNLYSPYTIKVHGIYPRDTINAKTFAQVYPEIQKRLQNRIVVAHNESFDRAVLSKSMALCGLSYEQLNIATRWNVPLKYIKQKASSQLN